jgi:hypothetical protein
MLPMNKLFIPHHAPFAVRRDVQEMLPLQYRVKTQRSLDALSTYLSPIKTRWGLRLWDADLPQTYLLSCEDFAEVMDCLVTHGVLPEEIHVEQDLTACVTMAASSWNALLPDGRDARPADSGV